MTIVIGELPNVKWYSYEETGNDITVSRVFRGTSPVEASREALLGLRETEISGYGYYGGHKLSVGAANGKGGRLDVIELTTVDLNVSMKSGYYSTFTLANNIATLPLERKTIKTGTSDATYLTWWNYDVRGKIGLPNLSESDKETIKATTDGDMDAALAATGYYFAKTNQARKDGESIYLSAKKPGTQSFLFPTMTVQENIYTRNKDTVNAITSSIGFLKYPENHAGVAFDDNLTDNENWLIVEASYKKVYGWYEATVKYKYANQGWDTDLYSELD